ncbi:sulfurtransferase TusA family protein [Paenibacillus alginolyticus]|uniref:Sulfurtransferase TusA family protein n=1 Tax=Paenibacillus alginolyticus TaxID=59839 RepID=A0ABT4GNJ5_9BACL|nr:sulfurtransferase TusA family protein [Paenibacillus alginolyticus]MCY9697578.1 sulfurtransferase TusA family protein [Paenibacillus alginolyticus]MEC0143354.1 sulfurtransferase TusA family protein [Paenibacillus alginolyticus]
MNIQVDKTLDAKGLACPMPIVRTKKMMEELPDGHVLEVQATDKGSMADLQSWTAKTGHAYLGNKIVGNVIHHYVRKASASEIKPEQKHPITLTNDELNAEMGQSNFTDHLILIDVREPAEYAFGHIPGALSIPLGALVNRTSELDPSKGIYVICRTGTRSDMAAQMLSNLGFANVTNIIPGMSEWTGPTKSEE